MRYGHVEAQWNQGARGTQYTRVRREFNLHFSVGLRVSLPRKSFRAHRGFHSGQFDARPELYTLLGADLTQIHGFGAYTILRLVAEGKTSKEIAVMLDLGLQTVRSYRKTMMKKLGVNNVAGLTQLALSAGLTRFHAPEGTPEPAS